jgi:hypothetical protein
VQVRELGIWQKQSSMWFQAVTAQTHLAGNVHFNGPRAGLNFVRFCFVHPKTTSESSNSTANCIIIDHFSAFESGLVAPFLYAA